MRIIHNDEERFLSHVQINEPEACWNWTAARDKVTGYGIAWLRGKVMTASRASFILFNGDLQPKEQAHHVCENRLCVNPAHLEKTSQKRHLADLTPANVAYKNKRKTHCPKGHDYSIENTLIQVKKGGGVQSRVCRTCALSRARKNKAKRCSLPEDYQITTTRVLGGFRGHAWFCSGLVETTGITSNRDQAKTLARKFCRLHHEEKFNEMKTNPQSGA